MAKMIVVFEIPDDQINAYADASAAMVQSHKFSVDQKIKHWSFDQEMRPKSVILVDGEEHITDTIDRVWAALLS